MSAVPNMLGASMESMKATQSDIESLVEYCESMLLQGGVESLLLSDFLSRFPLPKFTRCRSQPSLKLLNQNNSAMVLALHSSWLLVCILCAWVKEIFRWF
jgi:hypothetical protein